jgi:hypothetical protein
MSRKISRQVSFSSLLRCWAISDSDLRTEKEINIYVGLTEMQRKW